MRHISVDTLISFSSLALGCITTFSGLIFYYVNAEKKRYAAERDFAHLQRNQQQMKESLSFLLTETDKRFDSLEKDIVEIKTSLGLKRRHE